MSKFIKLVTLTIALTMVLSACSGANNDGNAQVDTGSESSSNQSGTSGAGNDSDADGGTEDGDATDNDTDGSSNDGDSSNGDNDSDNNSNSAGGGSDPSPGKDEPGADDGALTTGAIIEAMTTAVEQPMQMELEPELVKDWYHLDPALLEEYTIRIPMMNVKTNELAVLKVKDAADLPVVQAAIEQRAADVQKQFETYLPDQYENAKNYKLITEGNYILFVISESADELVAVFNETIAQ